MLCLKKVFVGTQEEVKLPTRSACPRMSDVLFSKMKIEGSNMLKLMCDIDFSLFKKHFPTHVV